MSISIYYRASRSTPLTDAERIQIATIEANYNAVIEDKLNQRLQTGTGFNGESFCIYDPNHPTEPDVVFEGATKLPDNSIDDLWYSMQHGCAALTEIRQNIPDAHWDVHVDDRDIQWDAEACQYDPSR